MSGSLIRGYRMVSRRGWASHHGGQDPQAGEVVLAVPVEYPKHRDLLLAGADRGPAGESGQCDGGEDEGPAVDAHPSAPVRVSLESYRPTGAPLGGMASCSPVLRSPRHPPRGIERPAYSGEEPQEESSQTRPLQRPIGTPPARCLEDLIGRRLDAHRVQRKSSFPQ